MPVAQSLPRLSEAQFLQIEREAEIKSEFFDGEMFALAGGSVRHSRIATNLLSELNRVLKGGRCAVYNSDLRLKVEATGLYTYPDLSVVCGALKFASGTEDVVVNPSLVAEVLSDSTEAYDRGKKFEHYRRIPSLREYLLFSQKEARCEQFHQSKGQWLLKETVGINGLVEIPSLHITLPLNEVYAGVRFPARSLMRNGQRT